MKLPAYQELSKEQDEINSLPLEASHLVTGPPGTGKTVMALYRTEMLTRQGAEARLLMYSRLLSNYVESAVDELDLAGKASTYHSWLYWFYKSQYRRDLPQDGPYMPAWTEILTKVQEAPPPAASMPFLIVDEGQDLPKEFFCWRATWRAISPYLPTRIRSSATTTRPSLKFVRTPGSPTRHTRCDGTTGTLGRSPSWPVASTPAWPPECLICRSAKGRGPR